MTWHASVLTIFPEMFPGPLGVSLSGKALDTGVWNLETRDIRSFAAGTHRTVDDAPYGGGAGMVMRPDVVDAALAAVQSERALPVLYLTPRGAPLTQERVRQLAGGAGVCLLCGRYEGIDQRVLDAWQAEECSVGDFVLSGGELAAMTLVDACVRLLPGVVGDSASLTEESFEGGLLEYPHFTRPATWSDRRGLQRDVPDVLLSGDHQRIAAWRRAQAETATRERRPDLWATHTGKDHRP